MTSTCPLCSIPTPAEVLAEAGWVDRETEGRLAATRPGWRRRDGACPACVQQALLTLLVEKGERILGRAVQDVWPLDTEAAFGALPTPLRMRADPRFTGRGTTIALVDAGFYPHADLATPVNRIRAFANAGLDPVEVVHFGPGDLPRWPGWDQRADWQWHGLMTSAAAAGNGALSHGLYRGMAPDAQVVLVQARQPSGHIGPLGLTRALHWLLTNHQTLGLSVVSISLGVAEDVPRGNPVDVLVSQLVESGVVVVVAAGNDGVRELTPPATSHEAITVGGLDDRNVIDTAQREVWHSNFGASLAGAPKPELVAPSIWVTAPIMPETGVAREGHQLFARRAQGEHLVEQRIAELRLITPHYQHVEGTSFAAPIVAGLVACLREANPGLDPAAIRDVLMRSCMPVSGASLERQGSGAIDAGVAMVNALALVSGRGDGLSRSPQLGATGVRFELLDAHATTVRVAGSWDGWQQPLVATRVERGVWVTPPTPLPPGTHHYKFEVGEGRWVVDPANRERAADGLGGWNSVVTVP